jgi:hypothetical protein
VSDFLDAVNEILGEYGEPATIYNRSGTVTATAIQCYSDEASSYPDYFPEGGDNADDLNLRTVYLAGTVTIRNGYQIALPDGTFQVLANSSPKEGASAVMQIAKCRKQ